MKRLQKPYYKEIKRVKGVHVKRGLRNACDHCTVLFDSSWQWSQASTQIKSQDSWQVVD